MTGYFWLKCPICGRHFGGHETGGGQMVFERDEKYGILSTETTCPKCPGLFGTLGMSIEGKWDGTPVLYKDFPQ